MLGGDAKSGQSELLEERPQRRVMTRGRMRAHPRGGRFLGQSSAECIPEDDLFFRRQKVHRRSSPAPDSTGAVRKRRANARMINQKPIIGLSPGGDFIDA